MHLDLKNEYYKSLKKLLTDFILPFFIGLSWNRNANLSVGKQFEEAVIA